MIDIAEMAHSLVRRCETTDPFRIADEIGVDVSYADLGNLKGMYSYIKRNRFIVVNQELGDVERRVVCAHELGHDQRHRDLARNKWLHDFMLYNMNAQPEYEANLFAAELLLPDKDVLSVIADSDGDYFSTSRALYVPPELLGFKLFSMAKRGYAVKNPIDLDSRFLRR